MAAPRDYSAEYRRRLANAAKRGLTRSQARGHARAGEAPLRPKAVDDRFEAALKIYRRGVNQAEAAKALNVAPERFRRFLRENVKVEGRGRTRKIMDTRPYEMTVISEGRISKRLFNDPAQTSLNGSYLNAVKAFQDSNDIDWLTPFVGRSVTDATRKEHPLETRPNVLRRFLHGSEDQFHDIYRLVI
jgi:hypothetical protein